MKIWEAGPYELAWEVRLRGEAGSSLPTGPLEQWQAKSIAAILNATYKPERV